MKNAYVAINESSHDDISNRRSASYLFKFLILANICMYLEAGAVPAMLLQIANSFKMTSGEQGLLGGIVYLSLGCAGPFSGYLLRHYDHRIVIGSAIGINNFFTLLWALTPVCYRFSSFAFISIRFFMGLTQCVVCVFLPIWTNEFAPHDKRTSWMGYLQASVPIGVMCGYVIASLSVISTDSNDSFTCFSLLCWRWPILIEVILVLPFCVLIHFVPPEHLNVKMVGRHKKISKQDFFSNYSDHSISGNVAMNKEQGLLPQTPPLLAKSNYYHNNSNEKIQSNGNEDQDEENNDNQTNPSSSKTSKVKSRELHHLRQLSIRASLFNALAARDMIRKSSDDLVALGQSQENDWQSQTQGHGNGNEASYSTHGSSAESGGRWSIPRNWKFQEAVPRVASSHRGDSATGGNSITAGGGGGGYEKQFPTQKYGSTQSYIQGFDTPPAPAPPTLRSKLPFPLSQLQYHRITPTTTSVTGANLIGNGNNSIASSSSNCGRRLSAVGGGVARTTTTTSSSSCTPSSAQRDISYKFMRGEPRGRKRGGGKEPSYESLIEVASTYSSKCSSDSARKSRRHNSVTSRNNNNNNNNRYYQHFSNAYKIQDWNPASSSQQRQQYGGVDFDGNDKENIRQHHLQRAESKHTSASGESASGESGQSLTIDTFSAAAGARSRPGRVRILGEGEGDGQGGVSLKNDDIGRNGNPIKVPYSIPTLAFPPTTILGISSKSSENLERLPLLGSVSEVGRSSSSRRTSKSSDKDFLPHTELDPSSDYSIIEIPPPPAPPSPLPPRISDRPVSEPSSPQPHESSGGEPMLHHMGKCHSDSSMTPRRLQELRGGGVGGWTGKTLYERGGGRGGGSGYPRWMSVSVSDCPDSLRDSSNTYYRQPPPPLSLLPDDEEDIDIDEEESSSTFSCRSQSPKPIALSASSPLSSRFSFFDKWRKSSEKSSTMILLRTPVYIFLVLAMTALYFVVTGVQFWGTTYMSQVLDSSPAMVHATFVLCAATGPTLGVFFGGWLVDKFGGYRGIRQRVVAIHICFYLGSLACVIATGASLTRSLLLFVPLLWMVLFFGGAILPACSGIVVSVVPRTHRPASASLSLLIFNLFGYCLSLMLSGYVMQTVQHVIDNCDYKCSLLIGFRVVLLWSYWSLLFLGLALSASKSQLFHKDFARKRKQRGGMSGAGVGGGARSESGQEELVETVWLVLSESEDEEEEEEEEGGGGGGGEEVKDSGNKK